jgi:hypothetical protein
MLNKMDDLMEREKKILLDAKKEVEGLFPF